MVAEARTERDAAYPNTMRVHDLVSGTSQQISITPKEFAKAAMVALESDTPFVNAAYEMVQPAGLNLVTIVNILPSAFKFPSGLSL